MNMLKDALDAYNTMVESGKLRGFSPFEVNCIGFILKDLSEGDQSGTLSEKVAKWFASYGFTVTESGVGWTVYPIQ